MALLKQGRWQTMAKDSNLNGFDALITDAKGFVLAAKSEQTKRKYASHWKKFEIWAKDNGLPSKLPVSPYYVGLFLTHIAKYCKSTSSLSAYYYGIKWAHDVCGAEDPTQDSFTRLILEGAKRKLHPTTIKKEYFTTDIVTKICSNYAIDDSSLRELRFSAMCVLAFAGFLRISEVLNLKYGNVKIHSDRIALFIIKSKNDVYNEGKEVLIVKGNTIACPKRVVSNYFESAKLRLENSDAFIFRALTLNNRKHCLNKTNVPMSYTRAREELKHFIDLLGLDKSKYGWHSFRHGGATAAAKSGVPDRLFKEHGRWRSEISKDNYVHASTADKLSVSQSLYL